MSMTCPKKEEGFTLVELMVTLVIFMFVMVATSQIFSSFVSSFKQQSKITETNIEGVVGLEVLRNDIEQSGFGLPWDIGGRVYSEASGDDAATLGFDASLFNDAPSSPPRAFMDGDGALPPQFGLNNSDIFVIRATNVAVNENAQRYTYVTNNGAANLPPMVWEDPEDNLDEDSNVIVLEPVSGASQRMLRSGGAFYTQFAAAGLPAGFSPPSNSFRTYLVYGINNGAPPPLFPFNRADYYIRRPGNLPDRCAPGTGVLYKATVNHDGGGHSEYPLLDCVADLQVAYSLDADDDGTADQSLNFLPSGATAETVRNQVRDVRVYVLAQEGQFDPDFTFTNFTGVTTCASCIRVGEPEDIAAAPALGRDFDLQTLTPGIDRYLRYRWKVYTMVLKPFNLR